MSIQGLWTDFAVEVEGSGPSLQPTSQRTHTSLKARTGPNVPRKGKLGCCLIDRIKELTWKLQNEARHRKVGLSGGAVLLLRKLLLKLRAMAQTRLMYLIHHSLTSPLSLYKFVSPFNSGPPIHLFFYHWSTSTTPGR